MTKQENEQKKDLKPAAELHSTPEDDQSPTPAGEARKEFSIDIYRAWCKSCGICAAFCPRQCIRLDEEGNPTVEESERCTGCGWCELHCPDFAISVHPRKPKEAGQEAED
jgi:2-oxoglutarate ferredoxin oxidoreductase subunit delta